MLARRPPGASATAREFVRKHDAFVDFTVDLAHAALELGLDLVIEARSSLARASARSSGLTQRTHSHFGCGSRGNHLGDRVGSPGFTQ